jgi:hypothetical protein
MTEPDAVSRYHLAPAVLADSTRTQNRAKIHIITILMNTVTCPLTRQQLLSIGLFSFHM